MVAPHIILELGQSKTLVAHTDDTSALPLLVHMLAAAWPEVTANRGSAEDAIVGRHAARSPMALPPSARSVHVDRWGVVVGLGGPLLLLRDREL